MYFFVCVCVSVYPCLHEQTPGMSKIHPRNLPISLDKPSRAADSHGCVDCPKCRNSAVFSAKTLRISPSFPPYNLPLGPTGSGRPHWPQDPGSSWASLLILPPLGAGLIHREGTWTNIARLTYVYTFLHTPSYTNILYIHRKAGIEYTTTNLIHSCNINTRRHHFYL